MAGSSDIYRGERGEEYFAWQKQAGEIAAKLGGERWNEYVDPADTVVDFGCGSGALLDRIRAARRIGVEANPAAAEVARARGFEVFPSAADLPDAVADVVITVSVLEHTLSPHGELVELHRALKPGGKIVLSQPAEDTASERRSRVGRNFDLDENHHLYTWTPLLLRNLLMEAGFTNVSTSVARVVQPPGTKYVYRWLPTPLYRALGSAWGRLSGRRYIGAVAYKPG